MRYSESTKQTSDDVRPFILLQQIYGVRYSRGRVDIGKESVTCFIHNDTGRGLSGGIPKRQWNRRQRRYKFIYKSIHYMYTKKRLTCRKGEIVGPLTNIPLYHTTRYSVQKTITTQIFVFAFQQMTLSQCYKKTRNEIHLHTF